MPSAPAPAPAPASASSTTLANMSDSELRAKLRPIFDKFDIDGSGMVSPDEIATMVKMLKMQMTDEQLVQLMVDADPDGSGAIDFDEFMAVLSKQLGEGKSDGLASVFSGASSMFGFLNPFSWFAPAPAPAPAPEPASLPTPNFRSLGGRGRAPPSPPGWLRGMPPLGQPQEAAPLRLSAIGYTQWVVQSSNRSTADGMREEEMLRKAFKAEQKARFLAAQHRRVRAIKSHERVGQKKAAEMCEHKRQYNQQLQQHLNAMQRYTNQKDAYEIYQKARTVKDGHQKQRLQREDENRKLADSGAAHENHAAREMRREQARVTREKVLAEKRQMAQHVQDETRPSVRQEGRNMFQAQRDAAAQAVSELTAENRGRIAFAKQGFVRENEQTHQEVQAMTRKARRARFELGSQRQQEADELRRKLEAERDRKRQLSGETSSWLLERHLSVFESRFASEEHAEKVRQDPKAITPASTPYGTARRTMPSPMPSTRRYLESARLPPPTPAPTAPAPSVLATVYAPAPAPAPAPATQPAARSRGPSKEVVSPGAGATMDC